MTKLQAYLQTSGMTQSALAQDLGISRAYLSELASGAKTPGLELAFRMETITGGAVPAKSWTSEGPLASAPATAAADHSQPMDPAA